MALGPLLVAATHPAPASARGEAAVFYWCRAIPAGPETTAYQSRIYRQPLAADAFPDAGPSEDAFRRRLEREGVGDIGVVHCLGPFDSFREAANDRALKARLDRIGGWTVFAVHED